MSKAIPSREISQEHAERMEAAASLAPGTPLGTFAQGEDAVYCFSCERPLIRGLGSIPNTNFSAIALRCYCGKWSRIPLALIWSLDQHTPEAQPVEAYYRYFPTAGFRDAFVRGEVWTTSLCSCKDHPDDRRADAGEGTLHYSHDPLRGPASNPQVRAVAARLGIGLPDGPMEIQLTGNEVSSYVPDAWMLCVSRVLSRTLQNKFGRYCAKINKPATFFDAMSSAIGAEYDLSVAAYRRVHYRERRIRNLEDRPGSEAFVKPPRYRVEAETRYVWVPSRRQTLRPRLFHLSLSSEVVSAVSDESPLAAEDMSQLSENEAALWRAAEKRYFKGQRRARASGRP